MYRPPFKNLACAVLCALPSLAAAQPAPLPDDGMAQRVLPCVACHGQQGRATNNGYFPRIAGKPAGYLYAQLLNFRDGRRSNASMAYLLEPLSDAYLQQIAGYFAARDLPYPPPQALAVPAAELARGDALVRHGDAARGIPACTQCHGATMTGVAPSIPGLLGLPRDYLVSQLGAWRAGNRSAAAPDCMARVAQLLSPQDIGAIASWLATQPVPPQAKPAVALPAPLPIACGSVSQ